MKLKVTVKNDVEGSVPWTEVWRDHPEVTDDASATQVAQAAVDSYNKTKTRNDATRVLVSAAAFEEHECPNCGLTCTCAGGEDDCTHECPEEFQDDEDEGDEGEGDGSFDVRKIFGL